MLVIGEGEFDFTTIMNNVAVSEDKTSGCKYESGTTSRTLFTKARIISYKKL